MAPKYSIVIGAAFDKLETCTKPCIEAIRKYTFSDYEIILVANGCTDGTEEWAKTLPSNIKCLSYPEPLGYAKANNLGIQAASGEFIILMNNDAILQPQAPDDWIRILSAPFSDPKVGITGLNKMRPNHDSAWKEFIIFFCVMIRREVFDRVGLLDEQFGAGTGEDIDFCVRAVEAGYKLVAVPDDVYVNERPKSHNGLPVSTFPIYHPAGTTVHTIEGWEDHYQANIKRLHEKYPQHTILCSIPTRSRYDLLALTIQAVAMQTKRPNKILIMDDGEHKDLREDPTYRHLFTLLERKGIKWEVIFGNGNGSVHLHNAANYHGFTYVWRIDDDEVPEPDVLERLLAHMKEGVGAVGGAVVEPSQQQPGGTNLIEDIFHTPNLQWCIGTDVREVDHLYSSYLYRAGVLPYCTEHSPAGHREETTFSYRLRRAGYKLIVDNSIVTYHFRSSSGGQRLHTSPFFFEHDDKLLLREMEEAGIFVVNLETGLGDNLVFRKIIPALRKKYTKIIIGTAYPYLYVDYPDVKCIPCDATQRVKPHDHVYKYMMDRNWKGSMLSAYCKMYGISEDAL